MRTQLLPQIIINYRRHDSAGLQPAFMMLWASAGCPLAVYNTVRNLSIPLQVQPQILTILSLVTWTQCCHYEKVSSLSFLGFWSMIVSNKVEMACQEMSHHNFPCSGFHGWSRSRFDICMPYRDAARFRLASYPHGGACRLSAVRRSATGVL